MLAKYLFCRYLFVNMNSATKLSIAHSDLFMETVYGVFLCLYIRWGIGLT